MGLYLQNADEVLVHVAQSGGNDVFSADADLDGLARTLRLTSLDQEVGKIMI